MFNISIANWYQDGDHTSQIKIEDPDYEKVNGFVLKTYGEFMDVSIQHNPNHIIDIGYTSVFQSDSKDLVEMILLDAEGEWLASFNAPIMGGSRELVIDLSTVESQKTEGNTLIVTFKPDNSVPF